MSTELCAEYIDYMDAYRIYNPDIPSWTVAYEDNAITSTVYCGKDGLSDVYKVNDRYFVHINPSVISQLDYVYDEFDTCHHNKNIENNILLQIRDYLSKTDKGELKTLPDRFYYRK